MPPPQPRGSLHTAIVDRLVQIAAEGRKYGLWLLLSTQRPSKIHPQVLSQCDNLMLMRMNSPGDLAELAEVFGFAPPDMLAASRTSARARRWSPAPSHPGRWLSGSAAGSRSRAASTSGCRQRAERRPEGFGQASAFALSASYSAP